MYKNNSGVRAINRLNGMYDPHVIAGQRAEDAERHAAWLQTAPGIAWALAEKKRAKANEFIAWSTTSTEARRAKVWADEQARRKAEAKARKK